MDPFHRVFEARATGIETVDEMPTVIVEKTPNGVTRHFRTNELLTSTPHVELLGRDLTTYIGRDSIDAATATLVNAIRSIGPEVTSVSIDPYQVSVDGPSVATKVGHLKDEWPDGLELKIILTIADHLNCEHGIHIERRDMTEAELWEQLYAVDLFSAYFLNEYR